MSMAVSEQRRKREAMDALIADMTKGSDDNVATTLRIAIEVSEPSLSIERV